MDNIIKSNFKKVIEESKINTLNSFSDDQKFGFLVEKVYDIYKKENQCLEDFIFECIESGATSKWIKQQLN
jgi:hypothetical protein